MILASTFAVMMMVAFMMMMVDALASSETQTLALNSEPIPFDVDKFENAIMELTDFIGELPEIEDSAEWWAGSRQAKYSPYLQETKVNEVNEIFQDGSCGLEMPTNEFEALVWACTLPDYSKLASELLSPSKPQRDGKGRFVKKVRSRPDLNQESVNRMAPIPSGFSFFKASYQPQLNKLIYKVQQFLASSAPIITILSITYQTTP